MTMCSEVIRMLPQASRNGLAGGSASNPLRPRSAGGLCASRDVSEPNHREDSVLLWHAARLTRSRRRSVAKPRSGRSSFDRPTALEGDRLRPQRVVRDAEHSHPEVSIAASGSLSPERRGKCPRPSSEARRESTGISSTTQLTAPIPIWMWFSVVVGLSTWNPDGNALRRRFCESSALSEIGACG